MRKIATILFILFSITSFSQKDLGFDTYRKLAKYQIKELKDSGAIVLRLVLHKKNAELYRKAGKTKLADKIEKSSNKRNMTLAKVLLDETFNFCKVYVIESKNYGRVINGDKSGYFLNNNLEVDTSIILTTDIVYFMEVGDVYESRKEKINGEIKTVMASSPVVQDVLILKDRNLNQLISPFPFYVRLTMLNVNVSVEDVKFGSEQNSLVQYTNVNDYYDYMKAKYKLDKSELVLADRIFYLRKRLYSFYLGSLSSTEIEDLKRDKIRNSIKSVWKK